MNPIETFEKMLASGQDNDMLRFTLGNAYFTAKDFTVAAEHFAKAVAHNKEYSAAWKMLGRSYASLEQHAQALTAFDAGMAVAAKNGDKQTEKEITVFRKRVLKQLDTD
ncbi:MAG: tetratricopeptide repeat protein [Granulosicoccaceae bacterium]